jgi:hypothetical protein
MKSRAYTIHLAAMIALCLLWAGCEDEDTSGKWYSACGSDADCDTGLFCGDGAIGVDFCTTACSTNADCQNQHGTQDAGCFHGGTCWKACTTDADCPGDGVCHSQECRVETPGAICGNGIHEPPEECDGDDFGGFRCEDIPGYTGVVHCTGDCLMTFEDCG